MAKLSPMMEQYFEIKEQYQDCILFFRLGDFYEMSYDDALLTSKELELTLTGKNCGQDERAPMCGVPYHSAEPYIHRLVEKGYKVAVYEALHTAGGVLVYGIPEFRLPKTKVVKKEIENVESLGVKIEKDVVIGKSVTIDSLMKDGKQFSTGHVYKIERINGGVILND